ncbi:TetR/AcrR family transcriptional regulator [bacterium]|nr:TetR/AcrR family transcriptional regulator [bacterium]
MKIARSHFKSSGYRGTSMSGIAAEAGLAVGTLYLYFPNKGELLKSTVEDFIEEHKTQIKNVLSSKGQVNKKLKTYLFGRFESVSEVRNNESRNSELDRKILELFPERRQEEGSLMVNTVTEILKSGAESGYLTKVKNVSKEVLVFMHSIAWFFLPTEEFYDRPPSRRDLETVIDWFIEKWRG